MSCLEMFTCPAHVSSATGTPLIFITCEAVRSFSAACSPTSTCWSTRGRSNFSAGAGWFGTDEISGRAPESALISGPTIGRGMIPGLSVVVWWAVARSIAAIASGSCRTQARWIIAA